MRRLASRRSAQVEHSLPRAWGHAPCRQHRGARLGDAGAGAPQRRTVHVERPLHDHSFRDLGVEVHLHASLRSAHTRSGRRLAGRPARIAGEPLSEGVGVHHERVRSQGELRWLVVVVHERSRRVGSELLPPHPRHPRGMRVLQSGLLRRVVGEAAEKRVGAFSRRAAQHGIDEPVARARARLRELDGISDDRAIGRAGQVDELI